MKKAILLDVDTQYDFMHRNGALYVPEAEDIIPRIADLMEYATGVGIRVISTMDTHVENDPEFGQYRPHCIKGTPGWHKISESLLEDRVQLEMDYESPLDDDIFTHQQVVIEKNTNDPFVNSALDEIVDRLNRPKAIVFGVATDHCVRLACLGLLDRGCKVNLILNATRPIREQTGRETIEELKERGVEFITSAEVMRVAV